MNRCFALVAAAGIAVSFISAGSVSAQDQPAAKAGGSKILVKTADDLPRYTYKIEGKASEFLRSDKPFKEFVAKVKADAESDLAKYEINDATTLKEYYGVLQGIAVLEGRWSDALGYVERVRAIEPKESKKLMAGVTLRALVAARKVSKDGADKAAFEAAFKSELSKEVSGLPWDKVREEVVQTKGRAEIMRPELVLGMMQSQLDPAVEAAKGELNGEMARGLINARMAIDVMIPLMPLVAETYGGMIESRKTAAKDIWAERSVVLSDKDAATPVVVAIWDSGTDTNVFSGKLWTNAKEQANGKDDDGNGFVDDVHGIAYDLDAKATPELLHPLDGLKSPADLVTSHMKGMMDLTASIESPEKTALTKYIGGLGKDNVGDFMQDLSLYGNYSHGTHVAGIAAEGNPFVRLLPVRITFDYRNVPLNAPSLELAKAEAAAARNTVNYMKAAGVRVVNMSWGGSRDDIENALQRKGVGKDAAERAAMSREIFGIQRDALEAAMKSAPEILFVAAAGNSDNNNTFSEMIPSGLNVPNMITVGAVDQSGKPTGFTTFGGNVKFYANGFEVDSYVPGGKRMKFSGTSMAAPNVANLAAKLVALNPRLTTPQIIELIEKGGDPMVSGGKTGEGVRLLINPKKSVELLKRG